MSGSGRSAILLGLAVVVLMIFLLGREAAFVGRASRTTGKIVRLTENDYRPTWLPFEYPDVEFATPGTGIVVQFHNPYASRFRWHVGDDVPVLYDPADPLRAEIDSFDRWLVPILGAGVGLLVAAEGVRRNARA